MWIEINITKDNKKGEKYLRPVLLNLNEVEDITCVLHEEYGAFVRYEGKNGVYAEIFSTLEEAKARYEEIKKLLIKTGDKND